MTTAPAASAQRLASGRILAGGAAGNSVAS
jgi:hypothetical protein